MAEKRLDGSFQTHFHWRTSICTRFRWPRKGRRHLDRVFVGGDLVFTHFHWPRRGGVTFTAFPLAEICLASRVFVGGQRAAGVTMERDFYWGRRSGVTLRAFLFRGDVTIARFHWRNRG